MIKKSVRPHAATRPRQHARFRGMSLCFYVILLTFLTFTFPTLAADEPPQATGLPLPRYASLRSGDTNMRTGPGMRYPIKWVFTKKGLPVQITAEFEIWRRVRDPDGAEGWVHKSALTGKRTALITQATDMHKKEDPASPVVAHVTAGVVGQIMSCSANLCRVKCNDVKGYLPKATFWGAGKDEVFE